MSPEKSGPAAVIVLAAGAGTRMKSRTPKILHEIGGRPWSATRCGRPQHRPAAAGPRGPARAGPAWPPTSPSSTRTPSSSTRTRCPAPAAPSRSRWRRWTPPSLRRHRRGHLRRRAAARPATLLRELVADARARTATRSPSSPRVLDDATGYGRILRGRRRRASTGIREHKDASDDRARDPRDQLRHLRLRRGGPARRAAGRSPPTTPRARSTSPTSSAWPARPAAGSPRVGHRDRWQVEGANDRVQLAALRRRAQPPHRRSLDARRRHRGGSRHHLDRRHRDPRPRTSASCPTPSCTAPPPWRGTPSSAPTPR